MPAKALLRPLELLAEVARVPGAAGAVGAHEVDVTATLKRRDEVINHLDDAHHVPWLESHGVTLVRGSARLEGERRVVVGDEVLQAREAVIVAVGTSATIPAIPGLANAAPWTSREVTTSSEIPDHLIVLGGGVVGVEMAQAWRSLGSRVTVVEAGDRLLAREEPFASAEVTAALAQQGIDVRTGVSANRVTASNHDPTLPASPGRRVPARAPPGWSSRSAARRPPTTSGWRRSGSSPEARSTSTTRFVSQVMDGCTRWATSTGCHC
jgi:dihydrolipoamide dehydrogenase